ncbi:MAG: substrate-binding domain-containing protein [Devosia sp.]
MTTLRQLAEHLGLSPATVSRALNGFPEVGVATRQRVIEGAERLHYRPNMHAKRLATGRSGLVGMIFRASTERGVDPHVMDFLASLSMAFADSEIDLVVHIASPADQMRHHMRIASRGQVDGMLLSAPEPNDPRFEMLDRRGIPFVVHGRGEDSPSYAFYDIDNDGAFAAATRLLIQLGHKRIALLNGPAAMSYAQQRERAYRRVMEEHRFPIPARFVASGEMHEAAGYRSATIMLSEPTHRRPTAFLCSSTLQALGVMRAASEGGLKIGEDISIISHDDVLPHLRAENFAPPLTVTRQPIRDAGPVLAQMMIARLAGTPALELQRIDKVDLIVRASTGAAPKSGEDAWSH